MFFKILSLLFLLIQVSFKGLQLLSMRPNVWLYETLGISKLRTYHPIRTLPATHAIEMPLKS